MNSTTTNVESWFIPLDIIMIGCTISSIILFIVFLLIIFLDKTCHTVPMLLLANSFTTGLICASTMLSLSIFMLHNDIKQIVYQDSFCIFRGYMSAVSGAVGFYSFVLQAVYRYISVIYLNRLSWRSFRFQMSLIFFTWIFAFLYPIGFLFTNEIIYNIDNQICMFPLSLSFSIIYTEFLIYVLPISMIIFIYLKLILYVKRMNKRITPANTLVRAQRELKMVRRTVVLMMILFIVCLPYVIFILLSFFKSAPKYHFRIAYLFIDISILLTGIVLFQFNEPLKTFLIKIVGG